MTNTQETSASKHKHRSLKGLIADYSAIFRLPDPVHRGRTPKRIDLLKCQQHHEHFNE